MLMSLIIIVCINVVSHSRIAIISSIVLVPVIILGYYFLFYAIPTREFFIIHFLSISVLMIVMTSVVISSVASQEVITIDTLLGSICGYLLIGLTWSYFYLTIAAYNPNAFSYHPTNASLRDNVQHFMYFSYVTLTTLGYGDILPMTDFAKASSWLETVTGQIYLAMWISQLVALHIAQRFRKLRRQK
jgi:hypothetical protein